MRAVIRVPLVVASVVIAWLCLSIVGFWIPRFFGDETLPVIALILGWLIYRDLIRQERRRAARRAAPEVSR